ncbi:hypothetical protein C8Q73DRAFT_787913 [Cubamyces lactineus]|nr:hypothetical protein C8Q73DRAFT_787913 [Cubamyces lactineus]
MPHSSSNSSPSSRTGPNFARAAGGRTSSESGHPHLRPTTPTSVHSSSSELGDNDIIPPPDPAAPRTLVLCFDGTGDQFDTDNSNVVRFFSLLKKDDRREQMVYYQAGIGTYTTPQVSTSLGQFVSKTLDEMVAWNLDAHVMSGYEFLMQNYEAGDKICLFGFSRGAYTARALAGMLHKVGLLPPHNFQQIPFAYKMYTRTDADGWKQSTEFKKAFCIDVDIEFIGVWDTVCSVGVIPHRLPFTASNTAIRTFRHALSLDERRAKFKANHYNHPTEWESKQGTHPGDMPRPRPRSSSSAKTAVNKLTKAAKARLMNFSGATTVTASTTAATTPDGTVKAAAATATVTTEKNIPSDADSMKLEATVTTTTAKASSTKSANRSPFWTNAWNKYDTLRTLMRKKGKQLTEEEEEFDKTAPIQGETDVKEVWFAGCHCDVGGGSVPDETHHALARIPLRWMIRECFRTKTGIRFHAELLKNIGLDPATLWPAPPPSHEWPGDEFVYPGVPMSEAPGRAALQQESAPPMLSVITATPLEKSHDDVARAEKAATRANLSAILSPPAPTAPPSVVQPALHGRTPTQQHARDFSQTPTLVNGGTETYVSSRTAAATVTVVPPGWGPDPNLNEEEEEKQDARCEIYDQLARRPCWWLLEFLPIEQRVQRAKDHKWEKHYRLNMGHGRDVPPDQRFLVHRSVKYRLDLKDLKGGPYKPRARWPSSVKPIYVD